MTAYTTSSYVKQNFSFRPSWGTTLTLSILAFTTSSYVKQNFSFRPSWSTTFTLAILPFSTSSYATNMQNSRTSTPQIPNKTIYPRTP